mmetsp:Transcript_6518/g.10473  ORF Transcript_6518/g.10473 Transcript_6518/m.10473 type:complete len:92 (+) Transcript_6518:323-598(+)
MYRSKHIGTKELEIFLSDWLTLNMDKMSYQDVEDYDQEILSIENPSLQRYLLNGEPLLEEHKGKYMTILLDYVTARKLDYYGNIPQPPEDI